MYIFDVKWSAKTAGPSPFQNNRTELFLLGCQKASDGNPCKGCFNSKTWFIPKDATYYSPEECAENLMKFAPNPFITIGGGEPLDYIEELIKMCRLLKVNGYHVLCYTWRDIFLALDGYYGEAFRLNVIALIQLIDGFIDGEFILEQRCYKEDNDDGLFNSIGSSNQHLVIQEKQSIIRYPLNTIESIFFNAFNQMIIKGDGLLYGTSF